MGRSRLETDSDELFEAIEYCILLLEYRGGTLDGEERKIRLLDSAPYSEPYEFEPVFHDPRVIGGDVTCGAGLAGEGNRLHEMQDAALRLLAQLAR